MNILQFKKDLKNLSFEEQTDIIKERIDEIITTRELCFVRMEDCEGEIEDLEEKIAMCDELIHLHHIRQSNAPAMENAET